MDPEQMKWLKEDLKDHQDADFIFVTFHSPPYSFGKHGSDLHIRELYSEIFEKNGVDVVFNGHNHDYERLVVGTVIYVVSGGGGATLYEVGRNEWTQYAASVYHFTVVNISGGKLTFDAKTPDGKTFDSFTLTSKRARQHSE
jgi:2',3'-cyclic-nucleotide 2'-phosphodiesterase (5'-nucleotidase family)